VTRVKKIRKKSKTDLGERKVANSRRSYVLTQKKKTKGEGERLGGSPVLEEKKKKKPRSLRNKLKVKGVYGTLLLGENDAIGKARKKRIGQNKKRHKLRRSKGQSGKREGHVEKLQTRGKKPPLSRG